MADTYLHTLYPNLRPQIDEAITQGYSYQEIQDQIAGRVNEARRNGYNDGEIEGYTGAKLSTAKQGYNPFLAQLYMAAASLNEGIGGFTTGITEPGQYLGEKFGMERSEVTDRMVKNIVADYQANAEYWEKLAAEKGAGFIDILIGRAIGGAIPGITQFSLGIPYYTAQGAIEARSKGQNEVIGAIKGAVTRALLGQLFKSFHYLKQPLKSQAMGITMAAETVGAGGTAEEAAEAYGTGMLYSAGGKGRIGIKEIRDLKTGRKDYKVEVRQNTDVVREEAKKIEKEEKQREAWEKEGEAAKGKKLQPAEVEGMEYKGIQEIPGLAPQYIYTERETGDTFYTFDPSKENLLKERDRVRGKFAEEELTLAEGKETVGEGKEYWTGKEWTTNLSEAKSWKRKGYPEKALEGLREDNPNATIEEVEGKTLISRRPGYKPPPSGFITAVRADDTIFAGVEGHTGIASNPEYMDVINKAKRVDIGFVDTDGKFYTKQEMDDIRNPKGKEEYNKFIEKEAERYAEKREGKELPQEKGVTLTLKKTSGTGVELYEANDVEGNKIGRIEVFPGTYVAEIWDLAVLPKSKRKGYGSQIVNQIESNLRDRGITKILVIPRVERKNPFLVSFYQKLGYKSTGQVVELEEGKVERMEKIIGETVKGKAEGVGAEKATEGPGATGARAEKSIKSSVDEFINTSPSDIQAKESLTDPEVAGGKCFDLSSSLAVYLRDHKGIKDATIVEMWGMKKGYDPAVISPEEAEQAYHLMVRTGDKYIDITGAQFGKNTGGVRVLSKEEVKAEWEEVRESATGAMRGVGAAKPFKKKGFEERKLQEEIDNIKDFVSGNTGGIGFWPIVCYDNMTKVAFDRNKSDDLLIFLKREGDKAPEHSVLMDKDGNVVADTWGQWRGEINRDSIYYESGGNEEVGGNYKISYSITYGEFLDRGGIRKLVEGKKAKTGIKEGTIGAEKARKETKLYGSLLDQQKQAEANLEKLAGMAITDPKKAFLEGRVEALEDYAVRVDREIFESKMESLHPFNSNDIWLQNGYESPGDFWNKVTRGNREAAKQVFDRNWKKVGELAEDVDAQIDKMINTAERMSREAFNSGDKIGAAREHKKLMDLKRNRESIKREHEKLKNEVDSMTGKMKDWATMESIDPEYRDQIQTILEDYDLHRRGEKYLGKRQSTLDFIAKQEELGEAIYIPEEKIRKLRKVPINDVPIEELRDIFDTVEQLAHLGKLKSKLISGKRTRDFKNTKDELLSSIKEYSLNFVEPEDMDVRFPSEREPKSQWGRFKNKTNNLSGATKVEYITDKLDGFKGKAYEILGKAYDSIFRPSVSAENERLRLIKSDVDALTSIIKPIEKDHLRMMTEQENVDGRDMTRMEMISVYLNSKNEGNRETLKRGLALTDENIDNIVSKLTPVERKFADDIMVLIQSKGPDIARVLRNLTGQKMKFEKDYFPIYFDYELSERAAQRQQETDLLKQVYMKVGAERGFTVSRVGGVEAPYLSFDVVLKHLERVNHFISSAEAIRDVQKILFDKDIRRAIESSAGEGGYREMVEWLKDWGNPKQGYQGDLDRWLGILRHNSTLATLGFKLSTTVLQPTAYLQLINRIGLKNSMVGLMDFYKDPHGNTAKIYGLSPFMAARSHSFDRDLMDFMSSDPLYSKHKRFKTFAMGMISALDLSTTLPAWQSAYNMGMKQFGWNEAKSIEYADLIVRRTQGSGMPKDLPGVLRGNNFKKSLNMFYTYFSSTYNEAARDYRAFRAGEENIGGLIKSFMLLFTAPAVIQTLLRKRENVEAEDFVSEIIGNVAGTIPYVGPIINAIITGYDYQASPIFEMPKQLVMAAKSKEWEKTMEHLFMASGYAVGIPARQTMLTIKYLGDVLSGRSYDPANLIYREKEKKGGWK